MSQCSNIIPGALDPNRLIDLKDGWFIYNDFGKYRPNLSILMTDSSQYKQVTWNWCDGKMIGNGFWTWLSGTFFKSKKNKNCFRIKEDGEHYLVAVRWGGMTIPMAGPKIQIDCEAIYYREATSIGGGVGTIFFVVAKGLLDDLLRKAAADEQTAARKD